MHAIAQNIDIYGKRTAAICAGIIVLSALLYGVFLLIAVERTASRAKSEAQVQVLSTELASLQGQYFAGMQNITPERAAELGYITPTGVSEVFAVAQAPALSLNNAPR